LNKLPSPVITPQTFPAILYPPAADHPSVNANSRILDFYVKHIVPGITSGPDRLADDGNYGSAATRDVEVLQALSRRIHFGACRFSTRAPRSR
jgi:chorismate mutase